MPTPWTSRPRLTGAVVAVLAMFAFFTACRPPEDPAVVAWRTRLVQPARLTDEELARLRDDVGRRVSGQVVRVQEAGVTRTLDDEQKALVFEALTLPAGVFDEGLRQLGDRTVRVLNAPARSDNAEIEATQRLLIDAQTLLPLRYEFAYAFPGCAPEQNYDLLIESK